MEQKPPEQLTEAELIARAAEVGARLAMLNNLFGEFRAISSTRRHIWAEMSKRGLDPKTGKRLTKRNRDLFSAGGSRRA